MRDNNFRVTKKSFLNSLKLNRRKGLKKFLKYILLPINSDFTIKNFFIKQNSSLFEHKNKIIKKKTFLKKENLIKLILKYKNYWFCERRYKFLCLIKNLELFFKKAFFLSTFFFVKLPLYIKFKSIYDKNKINFLVNTIKYLKMNPKNKMLSKNKFSKINSHFYKLIINADIKLIYLKLRENEIVQQTKMKVDTKKSILVLDDYKIITFFSSLAKNILNYFACCDNFIKVKFIIQYYIRLSLASTLKQKYKISSLDKIFKNYGENINILHPYKKNYKISFIQKNIIYN